MGKLSSFPFKLLQRKAFKGTLAKVFFSFRQKSLSCKLSKLYNGCYLSSYFFHYRLKVSVYYALALSKFTLFKGTVQMCPFSGNILNRVSLLLLKSTRVKYLYQKADYSWGTWFKKKIVCFLVPLHAHEY